jgi:Cu-Zn family superoxide dismutase
MRTTSLLILASFSLSVLAACERNRPEGEREPNATPRPDELTRPEQRSEPKPQERTAPEMSPVGHALLKAEADLKAAPGAKIDGEAKFEEVPEGVRVVVEVENAPPGRKGVHIHEKGDCSDIKGMSMGQHLAPMGESHGLPGAAQHHLGDLGNITIAKDGKGKLEIVAPKANLKPGDKLSFLGKAIVVHAGEDTGTGTSGNSGEPIACGVIQRE